MKEVAKYRCEASSEEGFIQQLAVSYLRYGYVFYVTGVVPKKIKDARDVDRTMIAKYDITPSKFTRARRKRAGLPNAHYLRHGDFWVLLVTVGHQNFFTKEDKSVRDARETPIHFEGYAVGFYAGKPSIRLNEGTYLNLQAYFEDIATKKDAETIASLMFNLPFRPYRGVRTQLNQILKGVNEARKAAGLGQVSKTCVRFYRRPLKVFKPD